MATPKFSIVIPAYKYGDFVGAAVQSVLDQTYSNLEVIVVNDASPDHTAEVVEQFSDPRVQQIIHERNKGLPASRNTGICAATGDIIALLDADDRFHPEKLAQHLAFLQQNPEIGVSYNPRFELNPSSDTVRELYRPPVRVDISHHVMGFQFSPSDMVIRREWIDRAGMFDDQLVNGAEDMDYPCRLALAGCRFGSADLVLNYRRYHQKRFHRNLKLRKQEYDLVLNRVFDDPDCPESVRPSRGKAIAEHNLYIIFMALSQGETEFGQDLIREAVKLMPDLVEGNPCRLVDFLMECSINNGETDHAVLLKKIFEQFPTELQHLGVQYGWAVKCGYLIQGMRAAIWGRQDEGLAYLEPALRDGTKITKPVLDRMASQLIDIHAVMGEDAYQAAEGGLVALLGKVKQNQASRVLQGGLLIIQAFQHYENHQYKQVPWRVLRALTITPDAARNKGVLAILARSIKKGIVG
jgi:glycosyltransferase involved in cell wall biosynthesis